MKEEDKKLAIEFLEKEIAKLRLSNVEPLIIMGTIKLTPEQVLWEIQKESEIGEKHAKIIANYVKYARGMKK